MIKKLSVSAAKISIFCENAKGFDLFLFVFADKLRETAENICMIQKKGISLHRETKYYRYMNTTKLTREEALRRWNASKETKRKMVERLERLVRESCLERTGKEPVGIEVW